jgi:hypothetical protein
MFSAAKSAAICLERVAYGYDKAPFEYQISYGAAETFGYQIEIAQTYKVVLDLNLLLTLTTSYVMSLK